MINQPRVAATFVAAIVLTAACVVAPGASFDKAQASGATPPAVYPTAGSSCISTNTIVSSVDPTMANLAQFSNAVVIGTFDGYGEAQWNTKGASAPATASERRLGVWIYRPIKISPTVVLRGSAAAVVNARVKGGMVGCDSAYYSDTPVLKQGATYVFFVEPEWDPGEARSTDPWVLWAWPQNVDGTVQTPLEGDVSVAALGQVIAGTPSTVTSSPQLLPSATP